MLVRDKQKSAPPQLLARNTAAPFAMLRAYNSARPGLSQYVRHSGLSGLGLNTSAIYSANQFNPEPISRSALQAMQSIEQFFHIGAGRQEADKIVPIQNRIHHEVLEPIAAAVNATWKADLCQSQLQSMLDALTATEDYWLQFLHNTQWSDGRAAMQAEDTLAFLFQDQERKLRELLTNAPWLCPVDTPEVIPVGGGTTTPGGPRHIPGSGVVRQTGGFNMSSALPWVLGGLFLLPKLFKR